MLDTERAGYAWPPHGTIPQSFGVSTFGARSPLPDGMAEGTVTLRPGKLDERAFDLLQEAGFRFVNIWLEWQRVETQKGEYDFSLYDTYMRRLQKRRLRAILTICYGNSLYCEGFAGQQGQWIASTPLDSESATRAFTAFAAEAARHFRYTDTGSVFEIWNEPNFADFWMGEPNPENYARLAVATADAIHAADADAIVIAPASSGDITKFVQNVFRAGLLARIDGVSHHFYSGLAPESRAPAIHALRSLIDRYAPAGTHLPLVDSENGYGSFGTPVSEQTQARYLVRGLLTNMLWGIDLSIWCTFLDQSTEAKCRELDAGFGGMGTMTWELHPKPSYAAMATLTRQLREYGLVERTDWGVNSALDFVLLFARVDADGGFDYAAGRIVAWTTAAHGRMRLPLGVADSGHGVKLWPQAHRAGSVTVTDMFGETREMFVSVSEGGERFLALTPSPVYVDFSL